MAASLTLPVALQ